MKPQPTPQKSTSNSAVAIKVEDVTPSLPKLSEKTSASSTEQEVTYEILDDDDLTNTSIATRSEASEIVKGGEMDGNAKANDDAETTTASSSNADGEGSETTAISKVKGFFTRFTSGN